MTHYFHTPEGPEHRREVHATIWDLDYDFVGADGVFSGSRLDLGTSVLFRETEPPEGARRLLDLGCGFGAIAVALARSVPGALVDAVDVNERALELTRENARRHGVGDRVSVGTPEEFDPAARYDEVWSNPPIRIGKDALHGLLTTWLARLTPDGVAHLVVGRNLGADSLARWLAGQGWDVVRTASAKGFRVLEVRRGPGEA